MLIFGQMLSILGSIYVTREGKVKMECVAAIHFMLNEGNGFLPTTPHCEAASSRNKKLGVRVHNMVGRFCKYVCIRLAYRMALGGRLGAAPGP